MTWQEELRKLDEDFSSGRITADEYRARRDQVLSSAVAPTQQGQADSAGGNAEATQVVRPAGQQQPQQPPSDATQIVPPADQGGADATQAVPGAGQAADPTQGGPHWQTQHPSPPGGFGQQHPNPPPGFAQQHPSPPGGFGQQHPSPPGGFPQQPPAPHGGQYYAPEQHQQTEDAPLWGGDEFPPIAPPAEDDWVTQGPEFESDEGSKGKAGKIIGAVLVVLLLGGIAFGAWWLWGRDSSPSASGGGTDETSETAAPTSEAPQSPTTTEEPADSLPIAELPGKTEAHPEIKTFKDVPKLNYLNEKELAAYRKAGAGDTKFQVQHLSEDSTAPILLTSASAGREATETVETLRDIQVDNGAKEAKDPPKGVHVTEFTDDKDAGQIRAHYVSGNVIVRIEVKHAEGLKDARTEFDRILQKQLEALPADA